MITQEVVRELIYYTKKPIECVSRELTGDITAALEAKQIIIITGVRRCGKSTILKKIANGLVEEKPKNVLYVNFEDERFSKLKVADLESILSRFRELNTPEGRIYLFLDEIQNIVNWEKWVTRKYEQEGKEIKFFISGSNASLLSSELSTALTGRNITFTLHPLSFKEFLNTKGVEPSKDLNNASYQRIADKIKHHLGDYIKGGGFPETSFLDDPKLRQKILQGYFTDIIHRDILYRYNIREVKHFENLAKYLMTNFTCETSYGNLAKQFEYGINTVIRYTSYLEQSFLLTMTPLFSYSLKKQQANPKKVYCVDNGLRNAVSFKFSGDEGRLAENLVFVELTRRDKELYYWKNKGEVDFVLKENDNSLTAINVTYGNEIEEREERSLREFKKFHEEKTTRLLLITRDTEKTMGGISYIPLWKWLLQS